VNKFLSISKLQADLECYPSLGSLSSFNRKRKGVLQSETDNEAGRKTHWSANDTKANVVAKHEVPTLKPTPKLMTKHTAKHTGMSTTSSPLAETTAKHTGVPTMLSQLAELTVKPVGVPMMLSPNC
jgi:hypothetical protein